MRQHIKTGLTFNVFGPLHLLDIIKGIVEVISRRYRMAFTKVLVNFWNSLFFFKGTEREK